MMDCKPINTPMASNGHLDLNEGGNPVDKTLSLHDRKFTSPHLGPISCLVCVCAYRISLDCRQENS